MNTADWERVVHHLRRCAELRQPVRLPNFAERISLGAAYAVQAAAINLGAQSGDRKTGYKIACTTSEGQSALGMTSPAHAPLFQSGNISEKPFVHARPPYRIGIECELAVILAKDVAPDDDIVGAIDQIMIACEVVEDRYGGLVNAGPACLVADNFAHRAYLLGLPTPTERLNEIGEANLTATIRENNNLLLEDRPGRMNPIVALRWLQEELSRRGEIIKAGEVILTGAIGRPFWPKKTGRLTLEIQGLGQLVLQIYQS